MNDCSNVTMREMLPDLLNGRLAAGARAEVEAHVASCSDCRAEFDLLRRVKASAVAPAVDVEGIAGSIAPYQAPSIWKSWTVRAAAAVLLIVGTGTVMQFRGSVDQADTVLAAAAPAELGVGALADISDSDLQAIAAELSRMKAVTSAEPEVVVPAVGQSGGDSGQ